jgi:Pyruvate/2-oxoacid:ferredoxin oxidoreductase delta subunit
MEHKSAIRHRRVRRFPRSILLPLVLFIAVVSIVLLLNLTWSSGAAGKGAGRFGRSLSRHGGEHGALKLCLWAVFLACVLVFLSRAKRIRRARAFTMIGVVLIFGVALSVSPGPMESVVKMLRWTVGLEKDLTVRLGVLGVFTIMAVVGNKLICGWGCQLGALQESVYNLPLLSKNRLVIRRLKPPYWLSNGARTLFLAVSLCLLFGWVSGVERFLLYRSVNYFKIFNWTLASVALYGLPILTIASFLVFRPFCAFVCPFGWYSWLLETLSIRRVRIKTEACIRCDACVVACPTFAMHQRIHTKRRVLLAECWACGECVESCPTDAVAFIGQTEGYASSLPIVSEEAPVRGS